MQIQLKSCIWVLLSLQKLHTHTRQCHYDWFSDVPLGCSGIVSDRYTVKHDIVFGCRQCLMIFGVSGFTKCSQNRDTQNIQAQEKPPLIHSTRRLKLGNPPGVKGVIINGLVVCEEQFVSPTCHGGNAEDHTDRQLDLGALQNTRRHRECEL